nr:hypothetical protein [uncultured Mucilaginibacter sp.]
MTFRKILLPLLLILAIASCKKDWTKSFDERLQGKWYLTEKIIATYKNGNKTEQQTTYTSADAFIVFNKDHSGLYQSPEAGSVTFGYALSPSGVTLTLYYPSGSNILTKTATIMLLTDDNLKYEEDAQFSNEGVNVIRTIVSESFTRKH